MLGTKLFARDGNALHLTPIGTSFLLSARDTIVRLAGATDHAIERERRQHIVDRLPGHIRGQEVDPEPSWLPQPAPGPVDPRPLVRTQRKPPQAVTRVNPSAHDYDVHIQFGSGTWPGMETFKLADEFVFPVCSPRLVWPAGTPAAARATCNITR